MIPDFDDRGLLPPGIHAANLEEIRARFGWTERRQVLLAGLSAWLAEWRAVYAPSCTVLVDGSFVRRKNEPEDIDVVLDLPHDLPLGDLAMLCLRCHIERADIKARYHVDSWIRHPALGRDLAVFFQYLGDKGAAELDLDHRHRKGIIRLTP